MSVSLALQSRFKIKSQPEKESDSPIFSQSQKGCLRLFDMAHMNKSQPLRSKEHNVRLCDTNDFRQRTAEREVPVCSFQGHVLTWWLLRTLGNV